MHMTAPTAPSAPSNPTGHATPRGDASTGPSAADAGGPASVWPGMDDPMPGDEASRVWRMERRLARHPGVAQVAVVARRSPPRAPEDERPQAALAVFVSPAPYQVLERGVLEAWVRQGVPGEVSDVAWFQMERLPRAPTGELLREELVRWWTNGLLLPMAD